MGEPLCMHLIEHYLRTRGKRYFRGRHDGEFFFVANAFPRRLHVHMEISAGRPDVFVMRVAPACFFPAADHARLAQFANLWNTRNRAVTAMVHGSSDPRRVGFTACTFQAIPGLIRFDEFAAIVDRALDAAVELFGELPPLAVTAHTTTPLLLDAG
ncbi:hypothetical protein B1987_10755 [Mycobacterium kansasii]|nr:hypothetical protein B1987_10755 [Mycobacterium kansasii]